MPQLLDSYLAKCIPPLADALLEYLSIKITPRPKDDQQLMPLSVAICRILYVFCKVRGHKVIVRFLSTEARYLVLLLDYLNTTSTEVTGSIIRERTWEERYICILWLSQLLFAPFDLGSIFHGNNASSTCIPGFNPPRDIPDQMMTVVFIGCKYIQVSGKEREAARSLLVRIATRRDVQQLDITRALMNWAFYTLRSATAVTGIYPCLGVISFLSGFLASSAPMEAQEYLRDIISVLKATMESTEPHMIFFLASHLVRSQIVKLLQNIVLVDIITNSRLETASEVVEESIGNLLERLTDDATPVRLAASKALSKIIRKIDTNMGVQIVQAVLESMPDFSALRKGQNTQLSTGIDVAECHGYILTLANFLYHHSVEITDHPIIINTLLAALSFEQRSVTGALHGSIVRDGACYGIWSLARKYPTADLQAIVHESCSPGSVIQTIANHLVVTALTDPAGNIRRGASAALQELVGRHPNQVENGITLVQTVDYHAIALRSRAMCSVAYETSQIAAVYIDVLFDAALDWRGCGDSSVATRSDAAEVLGKLALLKASALGTPWESFERCLSKIENHIALLEWRQTESRHGLTLGYSAILHHVYDEANTENSRVSESSSHELQFICDKASNFAKDRLIEATRKDIRQPHLLIAAACHCFEAVLRLRQITHCLDRHRDVEELLQLGREVVMDWLRHDDQDVIDAVSKVAKTLLRTADAGQQRVLLNHWLQIFSSSRGSVIHPAALKVILSSLEYIPDVSTEICTAIVARWQLAPDVQAHAAILTCLAESKALPTHLAAFSELVEQGLGDYTTNARGDVGSLVRIEAIKAVSAVWRHAQTTCQVDSARNFWISKMLRLTSEKLNRVRSEAQKALALIIHDE